MAYDVKSAPVILPKYPVDIEARDNFYSSLSFAGWGGASGHDAPMIAYDATLGSGDSWIELCKRGILHSGDNDSTGVMAGCWFGARFGFLGVPDNHYKKLEYRDP
jgi:ADP-ribosylarginine hydrolase